MWIVLKDASSLYNNRGSCPHVTAVLESVQWTRHRIVGEKSISEEIHFELRKPFIS